MLPSRLAVRRVGRDIACARKGRAKISDNIGSNGLGEARLVSPSSPPPPRRLLVADDVQRVMFGFGPRLGRYSELEDRWI